MVLAISPINAPAGQKVFRHFQIEEEKDKRVKKQLALCAFCHPTPSISPDLTLKNKNQIWNLGNEDEKGGRRFAWAKLRNRHIRLEKELGF